MDEGKEVPRGGSRVRWLAIAVAVAVLAAGVFVWLRFFAGEEPEEAALTSPSAAATTGGAPADGFEGQWTLDTESGSLVEGTSTFAGYRIEEELGGVGANTAVGRTQDVSGAMTIEGTDVTALEITVDMTTLRSDDDRRDGQMDERGLETASFPTATFLLTEPVALTEDAGDGQTIDATAVGELTLHGVTQEVEVPVQARWTGERIEVVGSLDVALADHEIEPPVGFLVLSIAEVGTIEFHLLLQPA